MGNDYLTSVSGGGWSKISTKAKAQGIDGVYERINPQTGKLEYLIAEFKYNTATYGTLTDGTEQLSQTWIADRLIDAVGNDKAILIQNNGYKRVGVNVRTDRKVEVEEFAPIVPSILTGDLTKRGTALSTRLGKVKDAKGQETGPDWVTAKIAPVDRSSEFSEKVGDEYLTSASGGNWAKISNRTKPQGIDAVYERINPQTGKLETLVAEFKYNTATYNDLVDGTQQLSKNWIEDRLLDAVGNDKAILIQNNGYKRQTIRVMPDGSVQLDEFTPIPGNN